MLILLKTTDDKLRNACPTHIRKATDLQFAEEECCFLWPVQGESSESQIPEVLHHSAIVQLIWKVGMVTVDTGQPPLVKLPTHSTNSHWWLRGHNCICLLEAFEGFFWEVLPLPTCFSDLNGYIIVGSGDFRSLWNVSWCSRGKNCLQNASFKIVWCVIETLSHWHSITKAQAQAKPRKTFQQRSW